jgi:hypothetical protein
MRADKRAAKRRKKRSSKCKAAGRLPLWFKYVTMVLCLVYCSVMSTITLVYGIKFTLRGEELARQRDITQCCGINITYFKDEITNVSMMSFELDEAEAVDRAFVTLEELAERRFSNITDFDLYDVYLYNDTVEIVRPMEEVEYEPYMILGVEGTAFESHEICRS